MIDVNKIKTIINDSVRLYNELIDIEIDVHSGIIEELVNIIKKFWDRLPDEQHNKMGMVTLAVIKKLGLTIIDTDEPL